MLFRSTFSDVTLLQSRRKNCLVLFGLIQCSPQNHPPYLNPPPCFQKRHLKTDLLILHGKAIKKEVVQGHIAETAERF